MKNFNPGEYRKDLAADLKLIRKASPEGKKSAETVLENEKETRGYQVARAEVLTGRKRNMEAVDRSTKKYEGGKLNGPGVILDWRNNLLALDIAMGTSYLSKKDKESVMQELRAEIKERQKGDGNEFLVEFMCHYPAAARGLVEDSGMKSDLEGAILKVVEEKKNNKAATEFLAEIKNRTMELLPGFYRSNKKIFEI